MNSRLFIIACLFFFTLVSSGCIPLIIGGAAGALGGYAIGKDTIQGETDKDYDKLWAAALTVAKMRGTITVEDKTKGSLELETNIGELLYLLQQSFV